MFEHIVDIPTVIGRHHVPEEAQFVADQFKAAGFPEADIHVVPYHTGSATTGDDDTAALIVRWRAAGTPKAKPMLLMGHMDVSKPSPRTGPQPTRSRWSKRTAIITAAGPST